MQVNEIIQLLKSFGENREVYLEDSYMGITNQIIPTDVLLDSEGDILIRVR